MTKLICDWCGEEAKDLTMFSTDPAESGAKGTFLITTSGKFGTAHACAACAVSLLDSLFVQAQKAEQAARDAKVPATPEGGQS